MSALPLHKKIQEFIQNKKEFSLQELYAAFGNQYKKHSIRARVYESNAYKTKELIRTSKGVYALVGAEIEAVVECVDTVKHIYTLVEKKMTYDMIFIDPPYETKGQRSGANGNRNLASYPLISPEEFGEVIVQAEKLLKDENSQLFFMISGGKSSIKEAETYIRMFDRTSLKLNQKGSYTKLTSSGKVCNMGKFDMPPELILSFSKSGNRREYDNVEDMNYKFLRPPLARFGGYSTQKPLALMKAFIQKATRKGERILDLFAGSGVTLEAGLLLDRKVHGLEISPTAIKDHILPRIKRFALQVESEILTITKGSLQQTTLFDFL